MRNYLKNNYLLIVILLIGATFRLYGLNWDSGFHLHPDERMITIVTSSLTFNDLNPHFFAYGSLPIYLLKITGSLVGLSDYQSVNLVGRVISSIFDLGTIFLIYLLTKNLFTKSVGLIAGFLYAVSVLPIQLSHFYAVDTALTFFSLTTLYFSLKLQEQFKIKTAFLTGACFGLALATKTSAILLFIPILLAFLTNYKQSHYLKILSVSLIFGISSLLVFSICEPFAIIDWSTFIRQTLEQQQMTKSAFTFPYTLQYVGKVPILYEVKNIFFWGLGPFIAIFSFLGIILIHFYLFKKRQSSLLPILVFFWIYFLTVSSFAIGFMRYLLPIYPFLIIFASLFIYQCYKLIKPVSPKILFLILKSSFLILVLVWPLSFISIYTQPNTRVKASEWIHTNIPPGTKILNEHWDDGIPLDRANLYKIDLLALYEPESTSKWIAINNQLKLNDYIIVASNRLSTPLSKLTDCQRLPPNKCYLETANYYQRLFSGQLGYTKVAEFDVRPKIPFTNFYIDDFSADESFTVYDHPKVLIFKKT